MSESNTMTAQQALEAVRATGAHHVKVGVFDIDGVFRGKYLALEKFQSAMKSRRSVSSFSVSPTRLKMSARNVS